MPAPTLPTHRFFLVAAAILAVIAPLPCWAAEHLSVGLLAESNVFRQARHYEALLRRVEEKTDIVLTLRIMSNADLLEKGLADRTLDAAFVEAHSVARMLQQEIITTVASPLYLDGSSSSHSKIFTLSDSQLTTAAESIGKPFALVNRSSATGYLYPLAWLLESGITDRENLFFTGSHDGAIAAVLDGTAKLGAASSTVYEIFFKEHPENRKRLRIIATSNPIPDFTFCMRTDLNQNLIKTLGDTLRSLHLDPDNEQILNDLNLLGFIPANQTGFRFVLELAAKAGLAPGLQPPAAPR